MLKFGNPSHRAKDGSSIELHLEAHGQIIAVVHGDLLKGGNSGGHTTGTTIFETKIVAPRGTGLTVLPEVTHVEAWWIPPDGDRKLLVRVQVDFWEAHHDDSGERIELQGRGPLAPVIDSRWEGAFDGDLEEILRSTVSQLCPVRVEGLAGRSVKMYVNSPSAYAALRLLGVSLDFVMREEADHRTLTIRSRDHARRAELHGPIHTISAKDTLGATVRRGAPLRRRTSEEGKDPEK